MREPDDLLFEIRSLLGHPREDRAAGSEGCHYDRLKVVPGARGGFDVVLTLDGGYEERSVAESACGSWQEQLDEILDEINALQGDPGTRAMPGGDWILGHDSAAPD